MTSRGSPAVLGNNTSLSMTVNPPKKPKKPPWYSGLDPGTNSPELLVRRFNPGSGRGYDDMLWISLLDWIPEPKGLVVQTRIRLDLTSHREFT